MSSTYEMEKDKWEQDQYIQGLRDEITRLRTALLGLVVAAWRVSKQKWDVKLLSSYQCEALDDLDAAIAAAEEKGE